MARGDRRYLLLHNTQGHWDFCKGRPEKGETPEQTIRREIREESGISRVVMVRGFRRLLHWSFRRGSVTIRKTADFRIARVRTARVRLSREHDRSRWGSATECAELLKFRNARALLRSADGFLSRSGG